MTGIFQIDKEIDKVRFVLEKQGIDHIVRARVGVNLDVSGSMRELYKDGTVQKVVERILPLGLACDSDGEIDLWGFSNDSAYVCSATRENYKNIVAQEMMDGDLDAVLWQGTEYAPVIQDNLDFYTGHNSPIKAFFQKLFGREPVAQESLPVINYFITDGENTDKDATKALFEKIEHDDTQIYYLLVGIGKYKYGFLRDAAQKYPNVGFLSVGDLKVFLSDDAVYEKLLPPELCTWLKHEHEGEEEDDHH